MSIRIMTAKEAVKLVESNRTLCTEGFVGAALAEELLLELQNRYRETGSPRDLTLIYAAGQGDGDERWLNHLGEEGLLSRTIGGHWKIRRRPITCPRASYPKCTGILQRAGPPFPM